VKNVNMKTSSPIYITIPLSQTSIQLVTITIIAGASLTTLAIIRRLRKPREIPIEIPIPLEPTPRRRSIDETIKEREVKKGPVVTLEDIIEKLKESGEKPEEILGELAEKVEKEKKQKRRRRKNYSFQ